MHLIRRLRCDFDRLSLGIVGEGEIRSARDLFLLIGCTQAYTCPSSWHIQHWVAPKSQAEQVLGCTQILAHVLANFYAFREIMQIF